jgi:ABC-type uncharacterized transport system auxiliary subunit
LRLDAVAAAQAASIAPALHGALQLLPFRARGELAERHVVYLDPSGAARPSATLLWEDSPTAAVAGLVGRVMQADHVADAVLSPDTRGLANYWLDGSIERFELTSPTNGLAQAVVEIQFTLFAGQERHPALIARYCRAASEAGAPARAFSQAVSAIGAALSGDIAANGPAVIAARGGASGPPVLVGQQITLAPGACGQDA